MKPILAPIFLLVALALAATPARADRDAVQFGSRIVVPAGESVHDAVCFFCSVEAQGPIDHDVVVFFGNVRVDYDGMIGHDVVDFFGRVQLGENASVGNDVVAMFGSVRLADSASINGNRVFQPAWLLWVPLMLLGGIVALIVSAFRSYRRRQYYAAGYYPPPPPPPVQPQA